MASALLQHQNIKIKYDRSVNIFNICFQILLNVGQITHVINFVQTRQAVIHVLAELDSLWVPTKNVKVSIHYILL